MTTPAQALWQRLSPFPHLPEPSPSSDTLTLSALSSQLSELSGLGDTAGLTMATRLILDAQQRGEVCAWVTPADRIFYPVDLIENGVDLDALAVIRVPDPISAARSADRLARSGAFGLLVLDLDESAVLPLAALARLAGLAQQHRTAIVFVTQKNESAPSLGSLIALRGSTRRERIAPDTFRCSLHIVKDKRRGPWTFEELCRGPAGLR